MMRPILEKTYPGTVMRPSSEIIKLEGGDFFMVATPWGNSGAVKELTDRFNEFLSASMGDCEATSPFAKLATLSPLANALRAATLYANEKTFNKLNQDTYSSACEALVVGFDKAEMVWVQVGQPHLLLLRENHLMPLQVALDLSMDYINSVPLPSKLFGIEPQIDIEAKSLTLQETDKLIVLARTTIPDTLFSNKFLEPQGNQKILDKIFDIVAAADGNIPFWTGIL